MVAAAFGPFAAAAAAEFYANAYVRLYFKAFGYFGDKPEFVEFLHHQIYAASHLLGQQGQFDVVGVFVTVADNERVLRNVSGEYGMEFGFAAGLQANIEFLAVAYNFLHYLAHLVYLNRVNHVVLSLIVILFGSDVKAVADFLDAVVENIGKAQQHRSHDIAHLQLVHHIFEVNAGETLAGSHHYMTFIVDRKIITAPAVDVVQLGAVFNFPSSHSKNMAPRAG